MVDPDAIMVSTPPFTFGAHVGQASPFPTFTAARRVRAWPPTLVKLPPKYRTEPTRTIAFTELFGAGAKRGSSEPSASRWARFARAMPLTPLKRPPT